MSPLLLDDDELLELLDEEFEDGLEYDEDELEDCDVADDGLVLEDDEFDEGLDADVGVESEEEVD